MMLQFKTARFNRSRTSPYSIEGAWRPFYMNYIFAKIAAVSASVSRTSWLALSK